MREGGLGIWRQEIGLGHTGIDREKREGRQTGIGQSQRHKQRGVTGGTKRLMML